MSSIFWAPVFQKNPFERKYRYLRSSAKTRLQTTSGNYPILLDVQKNAEVGLHRNPASWFAYYLIGRNLTLYRHKHIPKLNHFLEQKGRHLQKIGLSFVSQSITATGQYASINQKPSMLRALI